MTARPEYRLDRHDHSRCDGVMEIVSVSDLRADTTMPRRAAVRAGLTVAGAIALLTACSDATPAAPQPTTPPPTSARPTPPSPAPTTRPPAAAVPAPVPRSAPPSTAPRRRPAPRTAPRHRTPGGVETVPCDSKPIPPGKICTCNCVPVR